MVPEEASNPLPEPTPLKVLFFDIETSPMVTYAWSPYTKYLGPHQIIHDPFMLSWAAKWRGSNTVLSQRLEPGEAVNRNDQRIVSGLAGLVRDADIIVCHNSDKFDVPTLNWRVIQMDLEPLGPKKTIDTLKLSKKSFRTPYHRLDELAKRLGVGEKIETDFQLWRDCMDGNLLALKEMDKYCRHDVEILEAVFERFLPHVKGLPRLVDAGWDGQECCPTCGSTHLWNRGYYRTNASTFVKKQCRDCKRYHRARSSKLQPKSKLHPL